VDKNKLHIDGRYQREQISEAKVLTIAREWDWKLYGSLSVARRTDGSLWIYDGGHRVRAAFRRDDIVLLPCMIFDVAEVQDEARAFIAKAILRSSISVFDRHRAALEAGEPVAVKADMIVRRHGYVVAKNDKGAYSFRAIGTVHKMVRRDPALTDRVFAACVAISDGSGERISGDVLDGLFTLALKTADSGEDVLGGKWMKKLSEVGIRGLEAVIKQFSVIHGKGGPLVAAKGIADILNKGRRNKLVLE
jgi:hypothetical protein